MASGRKMRLMVVSTVQYLVIRVGLRVLAYGLVVSRVKECGFCDRITFNELRQEPANDCSVDNSRTARDWR